MRLALVVCVGPIAGARHHQELRRAESPGGPSAERVRLLEHLDCLVHCAEDRHRAGNAVDLELAGKDRARNVVAPEALWVCEREQARWLRQYAAPWLEVEHGDPRGYWPVEESVLLNLDPLGWRDVLVLRDFGVLDDDR